MSEREKGVFTLSLDTELAWGSKDKKENIFKKRIPLFKETMGVIDDLLFLMEKYEIKATWAIVGALLESFEEKEEANRFIRNYFGDKTKYIDDLDYIFCKKLLKKIKSSKIDHEIASHSYSHMIFDENKDKVEIIKELKKDREVFSKNGFFPTTIIFPRNKVSFLTQLKEAGYTCYRGDDPLWYSNYPKYLKKICHLFDEFFAITPPFSEVEKERGLVKINGSMMYLSRDGIRRFIPIKSRVRKAIKGIEKASEKKKIFHLWFHPFNIATDHYILLKGIEEIFEILNAYKGKGLMSVKTISEIY